MENLEQEKLIDKIIEFTMNIDEFLIGETIVDSNQKKILITDKTSNSIEVKLQKN